MMKLQPQTDRGRATRGRIVASAAELIGRRGVQATSLDEIRSAANVSKSQLYHYFANRDDLVHAVVSRQIERVLAAQMPHLTHLDSYEGLAAWFDRLVALQERRGCIGGCPIGSLANELADHDDTARNELMASFERWQEYLVNGLRRMQEHGELVEETDPEVLALATMASIQGGLLLTRTRRDSHPLRIALDASLAYLRTFDARTSRARPG